MTVLHRGSGLSVLGYSHCLMGEARIAVEFAEQGLKIVTALGMPLWGSIPHLNCAMHISSWATWKEPEHMLSQADEKKH